MLFLLGCSALVLDNVRASTGDEVSPYQVTCPDGRLVNYSYECSLP